MIVPRAMFWSGGGAFAAVFLAGCMSVAPDAEFDRVRTDIEQRAGYRVHWRQGTDEDQQVSQALRELLDETLTSDTAVQIALLNNHRLQATYQRLGIAQADLVQAGLLGNPIFHANALFPVDGGPTDITLGVTKNFLDIFFITLRKRVAEARVGEAQLMVTGSVLDLAYQTRVSFYAAQAAAQRMELFEQIAYATELSYDFAKRLHAAGNITELALHEQRLVYEKARMDVRRAETTLQQRRERMNRLMGVFGDDTQWEIAGRLPHVPEGTLEVNDLVDIETRAIEASLDLDVARRRIEIAGRQLGLTNKLRLLPSFKSGAEFKREKDDWYIGPTLSFPIPLFDMGHARIARTRAELRRQQERHTALAVEIRSIAREARDRLHAAEDIANHYRRVILPLRERLTNETQLQYNAMTAGLFELLQARERQIHANERYIEALQDYWTARATIEQLLRGRTVHDHDLLGAASTSDRQF